MDRSKVRGAKVRGAFKGPWNLKNSSTDLWFRSKGPWSSKVRGASLVAKFGEKVRKNIKFDDKVRGVLRSVELVRSVEMREVHGASRESHCEKCKPNY